MEVDTGRNRAALKLLISAAFVVAAIAVLLAWQQPAEERAEAASTGPEIDMVVSSGTTGCPGGTPGAHVCVPVSGSLTLTISAIGIPAGGYIGVQTFVVFGPDLTYNITGAPADEIVWPDCENVATVRSQFSAESVNHGCLTGLLTFPVSTYIGDLVELSFTCSAAFSSTELELLPAGDPFASSSGSGFAPAGGGGTIAAKVSNLIVDCVEPTPTPTDTPTDTPTPTPTDTPTPTITPTPTNTPTPTPTLPPVTELTGKIVFAAERPAHPIARELYIMNADGTDQVRVTYNNVPLRFTDYPVWSPDGTKIAFALVDAFGDNNADIYVMNTYGGGLTNLTSDVAYRAKWPAWSPDGSQIAFATHSAIYVMNADGTEKTLVIQAEARMVDWSPDGSKFAYAGAGADIYVVNFDGSDPVNISKAGLWDSSPAWSPDGTKILFRRSRDIYIMNADGSEQTNLTNAESFDEYHPAWSPDGTQITFSTFYVVGNWRDGEIYVMSIDGSAQSQITASLGGLDSMPDWRDPVPPVNDTDVDGCDDVREFGTDETLGGRRSPTNYWDFYDVAVSGAVRGRDGQIDLFNDIVSVIDHYAPTGLEPEYDAWYDRGPSAGPSPWNMTGPDGKIDLFNDIMGVISQFGHDCR